MKKILLSLMFVLALCASARATEISISSFQPSYEWRYGGTTATIRVYVSQSFVSSEGISVLASPVGGTNFYKTINCTVAGTVLTVSGFTLYSTTNATPTTARYTLIFFQGSTKRDVLWSNYQVPVSLGTTISNSELEIYNRTAPAPPRPGFPTTDQVQQLINAVPPTVKMTDSIFGIGKLSVPAATSTIPTVVGTNDPRLVRLFNIAGYPYSAVCDGSTSDTAAIAAANTAAVLLGGAIYIPPSASGCKVGTATITAQVVSDGGTLTLTTGQTTTFSTQPIAGKFRIFRNALSGQGTVALPGVAEAFPQWWGGDDTGVASSATAINAAIASGAKVINMKGGSWGLSSPIFLPESSVSVSVDGGTRLGTIVFALSSDISTGGSPNALFVCKANAWNGTLKSMRFPTRNGFSGIIISAAEGGTTGEQAMFGGNFHDLEVDAGSLVTFFRGGLYDSWFDNIQFESIRYRFQLTDGGGGADNVHITNINDTACFFPFLEAISTTPSYFSGLTIDNVTVARHQNDFWLKAKNVVDLKVSHVKYQMNDGVDGSLPSTSQTGGFASIESGTRFILSDFNARRQIGLSWVGIKLIGTQAKIHHGFLAGMNGTYGIKIEGSGNEIDVDHLRIEGPEVSPGTSIDATATPGGILNVSNSTLTASAQYLVNITGTLSANFYNNSLTDGNYNLASTVPNILLNSSGTISFFGNTVGTTDVLSDPTFAFKAIGAGQWWMLGNRLVGLANSKFNDNTSTQIPISLAPQGEGASLVVSSNTITPVTSSHLVGAGLIKTITVPAGFTGGPIYLMAGATPFTCDASGNIAKAVTGLTAGQVVIFYYSLSDGKWHPSF